MWRRLRIIVLLLILLFVALNTYFDRVYSTDWNIPLRIAAYPINADGRLATEQYIRRLSSDALQGIEIIRLAVRADHLRHDHRLRRVYNLRDRVAHPIPAHHERT
jgi:hypothetical protein